jgi:hypothetical protein
MTNIIGLGGRRCPLVSLLSEDFGTSVADVAAANVPAPQCAQAGRVKPRGLVIPSQDQRTHQPACVHSDPSQLAPRNHRTHSTDSVIADVRASAWRTALGMLLVAAGRDEGYASATG